MAEILHFPRRGTLTPRPVSDTGGRALNTAANTLIDAAASLLVCPDHPATRLRCIAYAEHRIRLAQLCLDLAMMTEKAKAR